MFLEGCNAPQYNNWRCDITTLYVLYTLLVAVHVGRDQKNELYYCNAWFVLGRAGLGPNKNSCNVFLHFETLNTFLEIRGVDATLRITSIPRGFWVNYNDII